MGFFGLFGGPQKDERTEIWETTIQAALDAFARGEFVTALSCATGAEKTASAFPEGDPRRAQTTALLEKIRRAQPATPAAPLATSPPKTETPRPGPSPMNTARPVLPGFAPSAEIRKKVDDWLAAGGRHLEQGDLAESRDAHIMAYGFAAEHDDGEGVLLATIRVTLIDQLRGLRTDALEALADRLELAALAPDPRFAVHLLQGLAFLEIELGRFGEAKERFDRAFEIADGLGADDREDASISVRGVVLNVIRRSEIERSRRTLEEEIRTLPAETRALRRLDLAFALADLELCSGEVEAARTRLTDALAATDSDDIDVRARAHSLLRLGQVHCELGESIEAVDRLTEAAEYFRGSGYGTDARTAYRLVSVVFHAAENLPAAIDAAAQCLEIAAADGDVDGQLGMLDILAHLHADAGNDDAANLAEARIAEIKASGDAARTSRSGLGDHPTGIPAHRGALGEIYRRTGGPALGRLFGLGLAPAN